MRILDHLQRAEYMLFFSTPISISSNKGKKRARSKSTFISSKYLQNAIKLKQKFLNNLFQYFLTFFIFSISFLQDFEAFESSRFY